LEHNGQYFTTYFGGELTPLITLTKAFVKPFTKRTVVNVSSNVAFGPKRVKQLGLYSAAKAAREVLIQTMALEDKSGFYLNWAPGAMETSMYDYMHEECDDINWSQLKTVQPAESARTLFQLITQEKTEKYNGKHVDFHEVRNSA